VDRHALRDTLGQFLGYLMPVLPPEPVAESVGEEAVVEV
jgi:hypothetical protein